MGGVRGLLVLWPPSTSLLSKFPCILNLPPTTQSEWSALSSASPCPPCIGTGFRFRLGTSCVGEQTIEAKESFNIELLFDGCLPAPAYVLCLLRIRQTETRNSTRVVVKSLFTLNPGKVFFFYCTRHYSLSICHLM